MDLTKDGVRSQATRLIAVLSVHTGWEFLRAGKGPPAPAAQEAAGAREPLRKHSPDAPGSAGQAPPPIGRSRFPGLYRDLRPSGWKTSPAFPGKPLLPEGSAPPLYRPAPDFF